MDKNIPHRLFIVLLCLAAILSGCEAGLPFFPMATPTVTTSPTLTKTITPTPTSTETPTLEPTATPEQLGGPEVAYLYDGRYVPMPDGVKALLTPSSPETWKQTGWQFTDGTPYPWESIIYGPDNQIFVVVPALVRGVVEIPSPVASAGGKLMFVVLETPARRGSNFIIVQLQDNKYSTNPTFGIARLTDGKVPLNWVGSSWENPLSYDDFSPGYTLTGVFTGRQISDELNQHIGQMVMVSFQPSAGGVGRSSLQQIVQGTLINQDGQSGVDDVNSLIVLTLP